MNHDELVKKINFLAKKSKSELGLTLEEKEERKKLRQIYIDRVKSNFEHQLQGIIQISGN